MPFLARRYPEFFQIIVCLFIILFGAQFDNVMWMALQLLISIYVLTLIYSLYREYFILKGPDFKREEKMGYEPIPEEVAYQEEKIDHQESQNWIETFEREVKENGIEKN